MSVYNFKLDMSKFSHLNIFTIAFILSAPAWANEPARYSPFLSGPLGLNIVPNARMDPVGTIRASVSTQDPYMHGSLGFQVAEPLYISFRQTSESSSLLDEAERLYPGIDAKLRLMKETRTTPEIAIGLQSAFGHKRMAGEYLALSKRVGDFDFTGGMGWGRFGSAGHIKNPLRHISNHFEKNRIDQEMPNDITNWFTGEKVGFFGGIEYFTPLDGLSIKADYGADRYSAETAAGDFDAPAPWALGLSYSPNDWMNASIGTQGFDKIMARISFSGAPSQWPFSGAKAQTITPLHAKRVGTAEPQAMHLGAEKNGVSLVNIQTHNRSASATFPLKDYRSAPAQYGIAAVGMANHAGTQVEAFTFTPQVMNLRGPSVSIMRSDLENVILKSQGSAAEIWQNTEFSKAEHKAMKAPPASIMSNWESFKSFRLILENQISLSEEDSGTLHRSSLIAESKGPSFFGLLHTGAGLRLNLHDNLERLNDIRPQYLLPVRSNVSAFADQRVSMDRLYASFTHSFTPALHTAITGGYLEEMYGGLGGEILYRPFDSRWAIGLESWLALKRDPYAELNMGFNGDSLLSGHINAWYDLDNDGLTLHGKFGRFLAEDIGGTIGLSKEFQNGASIDAFITLTDTADFDLFGGTTHAYHGVRLSLPLGSVPYIPPGSRLDVKLEPFGRDIGQSIDNPVPLYALTEPFSEDHLARYWDEVIPQK